MQLLLPRVMRGHAVSGRVHPGFTMTELLTVVAIVAILMAALIPTLQMVRRKAAAASAHDEVAQLGIALETYRHGDRAKRYPEPQSDGCLSDRAPGPGSTAVLALLESGGGAIPRVRPLDEQGRLLDPWRRPYRYQLTRPAVGDPTVMQDWNWDAAAGRERAWGRRWDAGVGAITAGALPFAYVYSTGPDGRTDAAAGWIFVKDGQ